MVMKLGEFLFASLMLSASSWAQTPAPPLENARRTDGGMLQHQREDSQPGTELYFPDYVDGGGWSVQLALSNVDPESAAEVVVEVYDEDGAPVLDLFDSGLTFEIPSLGSRVLRSAGARAIRRGWIQVRTGTNSVSGLLTYKEGTTGIEVSVEPAYLDVRFALFVEESDNVGAGVAVFKPEAQPNIQLRIRDEEGNDPLKGAFVSRGNFHQLARTLPEWFTADGIDREFLRDFRGLLFLRTEDESTFAPLGLRFGKRNQSLSSVPAIRDEKQEPMETTLYFPDYVDGGGWSVQLALSNFDTGEAASVMIAVHDQQGRSVSEFFDSGEALEIPSLGSRVLRSVGAGRIRRGWVQVQSTTASVRGLLTYRNSHTGIEVGVEPVPLRDSFALFLEETEDIGTGLAIFKPDAASEIEFHIRDQAGSDPMGGVLTRGDFKQQAQTIPEWFEGVDQGFLGDFRGLLFLRTGDNSLFAPLGLRFGKTGSHSLSAVPAIRIMAGDGIDGDPPRPPTVTMSVSPSSIDWGQSTTLSWSSSDAVSATITPDVGAVPTSGSLIVSPNSTTIYRIAVRGRGNQEPTARASVKVTVSISARAALRALYDVAGGPDWTDRENWGSDKPLEEWDGVLVNDDGKIIGLSLSGNNLKGKIPPELGALVHLEYLRLGYNGLDGKIPPELGALGQLRVLDLADNNLRGEIPPELGALTQLESLILPSNHLWGKIPPELGALTQLRKLNLSFNELTGEIPPDLASLVHLEILDLGNNYLTGKIPEELGALVELKELNLGHNEMTGEIPTALRSLAQLRRLRLNVNHLTGKIPPELGALAQLEELWLGHNDLTGEIIPELSKLTQLRFLQLRDNHLTGEIPAELGLLAQLRDLRLSGNRLTGEVPEELGALGQLWTLELADNELTGVIPIELSSFANLWKLELGGNDGLCVPGETALIRWSQRIGNFRWKFCNDADRAVLELLYEVAGGARWMNSAGWGDDPALGEWYGVRVDSLGRVTSLDLSHNGLAGRLPGTLGNLTQLTELRIEGNALAGRLPVSLSSVSSLQELNYAGTELCAPTGESFRAWLATVPSYEGTRLDCAPPSDREFLMAFYDATGGPYWRSNGNWGSIRPLGEWHGVTVNGHGRVTRLVLENNRLEGEIPVEMTSLNQLEFLRFRNNDLSGEIPPWLARLPLLEYLDLGGNRFSGEIPPELGALTQLRGLWLYGNNMSGEIPPELGALTQLTVIHLSDGRLTGEIPPELGGLSRLRELNLGNNELTDEVPSSLGALHQLGTMDLAGNQLTGEIPRRLATLTHLTTLDLSSNRLTGEIPPSLGALTGLGELNLSHNQFTGEIPDELNQLSRLELLDLAGNQLTGEIPPSLGALTQLATLDLAGNHLAGEIPPSLGSLENLLLLDLSGNTRMSGVISTRLADLRRLTTFMAEGTGLCAPPDARFLGWLDRLVRRRLASCHAGTASSAYLTQAVQSRTFPVGLVAGEAALLRVFVTSSRAIDEGLPPVRATFFLDGAAAHVVNIPGQSEPIPTRVKEGDLDASVNAAIPGWVVQPGLEMVIDVDPDETLGPKSGVTKQIPNRGRLAVDVRKMPHFKLTVIPFVWSQDSDVSVVDIARDMALDPQGHSLLWHTRTVLPVGELAVKAHPPVVTSAAFSLEILRQTEVIRIMEGGDGHYLGMSTVIGGVGIRPGWSIASPPRSGTIAHELGHNWNLGHAPCGNPGFLDPRFPQANGSIGAWGYDFRNGGHLVSPSRPDLMSYCRRELAWISEYNFVHAFSHRLSTTRAEELASLMAAPTRSLLLWGGTDPRGVPFLEPVFVVEAPAALPRTIGDYELTGRTAAGEELFTLSFDMPEVADGDGGSVFVFSLPVQPDWADQLATVSLSGPGGVDTLDKETDHPMTILRNPRTGQIRGIMPSITPTALTDGNRASPFSLDPGLEKLTSRGIPDPQDWTR